MKAYVVAIASAFYASTCLADYVATGPYEGEVCAGIVIKKCSLERLDAIRKEGKFYEINKIWKSVDDYKNGRCWISFGKGSFGFLDGPPEFYQYDENNVPRPVDVDSYVTFSCQKK